ncbi:protocadherin-16-like [Stigmatopora argus]
MVWVLLVVALLCAPWRTRASELTLSVPEGLPAGTAVGDLAAALSRPAAGFLLSEAGDSQVFRDLDVRPDTGLISTAAVLDRETRASYEFAAASLSGEVVRVRILVEDVNDHSPEFPSGEAQLLVSESAPPGARFRLPGARDRDVGELGVRGYRIRESDQAEFFRVEPREPDLDLVLRRGLDRESRDFYTLTVEAFDGGVPVRVGTLRLNVTVLDENDNPPAFRPRRYAASVPENATVGTSVCRVGADDPDAGDNGRVGFSVEGRHDFFSVDQTTGVLYLNRPLDFETQSFHEVMVTARDFGVPPESSGTLVLVTVDNVNDNAPVVDVLFLGESGRVSEAAEPGDYVARVSVSDPDDPEEAPDVRLEGGGGDFLLERADRSVYVLRVAGGLDREEKDLYALKILVRDSGSPPLGAEALIPLRVTDVNDCAPYFDEERLRVRVSEDLPVGASVVRVEARDSDLGVNARLSYSILESECPVRVDGESGLVTTAALLDRDRGPDTCCFLVAARDGGRPARSASVAVTLLLLDVNDNPPAFRQSLYRASVTEHAAPGTCFSQVAADDADTPEFGVLVYSLPEEEAGLFRVDPQSGRLCISGDIDRDGGRSVRQVLVRAQDPGGLQAHAWVRVEIQDLNDNAPEFQPERYAAAVGSHAAPGVEILAVSASDADDGAFGRVAYRLLPGDRSHLFALDEQTGTLYLTSSLSHLDSTSIELAVAARDAGGLRSSRPARVTVDVWAGAHAPPAFRKPRYAFAVAADTPAGAAVGSVRALNAPDCVEPVSYRIASGDPRGLFAVDPTSGLISTAKDLERRASPYALLYVQAHTPSSPVFGEARVRIDVEDAVRPSGSTPPGADSGMATLNLMADPGSGTPVLEISGPDGEDLPRSPAPTSETPLCRAQIAEDAVRNSALLRLSVRGGAGDVPLYSLVAEAGSPPLPFRIHPRNGQLYLADELDYERESAYRFRVLATVGLALAVVAVEVSVMDVNDNPPVFGGMAYFATWREGPPPAGPAAARVAAGDRDAGENGRLSYALLSGEKFFRIHPETGEIFSWVELDREQKSQHMLEVTVNDRGRPRRNATARVHVLVADVNDNPPRFVHRERRVQISSGIPTGSLVTNVFAKDADAGENGTITYTLQSGGRLPPHFEIDAESGDVRTTSRFGDGGQETYVLRVTARDGGSPPLEDTALIHLRVSEDRASLSAARCLRVREDAPPGTVIGSLAVSSLGRNVDYSVPGDDGDSPFGLDSRSGDIYVRRPPDYEAAPVQSLVALAEDRLGRNVTLRALVTVEDANDHPPRFPDNPVTFALRADAPPGSLAFAFCASDGDASYPAGALRYSVASPPGFPFRLDPRNGRLTVAAPLDRPTYAFTVTAGDRSERPREASVTARVFLLDVDRPVRRFAATDANQGELETSSYVGRRASFALEQKMAKAPVFGNTEYRVWVAENAPAGTSVAWVGGGDPDGGLHAELHYDIVSGDGGGRFRMDPVTGVLALHAPLDYEEESEYVLTVRARDGEDPWDAGNVAFATVFVEVSDENDHGPRFASSTYNCSVSENLPPFTVVCSVRAADGDGAAYGRLTYSVLSSCSEDWGESPLTLDPRAGVIRTRRSFDYERQREYCLLVEARDAGDQTATVRVHVYVKGTDEFDPVFSRQRYRFFLPEDAESGLAVGFVTALDRDGGADGAVEYSLSEPSPRFRVDKTLGAVYASGVAELTVFAAGPRAGSRRASCRVSVEIASWALPLGGRVLGLSVSLAAVLLSLLVFAALVLRSKHKEATGKTKGASSDAPDGTENKRTLGAPENRRTPSDRSGRGSAEGETAEDQEIRRINGERFRESPDAVTGGTPGERDGKDKDHRSPATPLWEHLLDPGPEFPALAAVFADIGSLPDRAGPPPLITSVARPGLRSVPPRPRYAYPPLARNTGLTPRAMTPTFTPTLSWLTSRSPGPPPLVSEGGLDSGPPAASLLEAEIQV